MRLRVVTYNIHRAIGIDRRFRPERIIKILDHMQADIVLLQEVDNGAPRSRELDLAKELADALAYPYYAVGHNVTLRKGTYGNATLSLYPIIRERNIDLTIENRKRRGCQHTLIEIQKIAGHPHFLDVFNLHLGLSAREREQQLGLLMRSSEFTALSHQQPCLVGGDFNDWRARLQPIFTEIMDFKCATNQKHSQHQSIRTYPSFSPTGGLDKLFYRGHLRALAARRCRLAISKLASDHLPIMADFELT